MLHGNASDNLIDTFADTLVYILDSTLADTLFESL